MSFVDGALTQDRVGMDGAKGGKVVRIFRGDEMEMVSFGSLAAIVLLNVCILFPSRLEVFVSVAVRACLPIRFVSERFTATQIAEVDGVVGKQFYERENPMKKIAT
jgi:hypothetical protein